MSINALVVDDEADIRDLVSDVLKDSGFTVKLAANSVSTFETLAEKIPDVIILDIWLKNSELDGLGILEVVRRKYPELPVVMISGHGNIETAINSLKMGAYDYVEKPFKQDRLIHTLKRAVETARLQSENRELKVGTGMPDILAGNSSVISHLRQAIDRVAPTGSRVFITGPAGSGKEYVAQVIHNNSLRKNGPFIALNAASLTQDNVDIELFGTEESTDLTAPPRKTGVFERANGGTLFIDEITDIPLKTQGRFVRFLQDKSFERIGSSKRIEVDVRVIAATNRDIDKEIREGRFREDLFYRLNVVPLRVPALKERREDIATLCEFFLAQAAEAARHPVRKLSDEALAVIQAYDWPGNVRQLRNVIEWLLIMHPDGSGDVIGSEMLPRELFDATPAAVTPDVNTDIMSMKLREAREIFERQYLTAQINRFGGNISRTATFIGMERSALHRKLKSLEVFADEREKMSA